jgi:hypothetical protein
MEWVLLILCVVPALYLCFLVVVWLAETGYAHLVGAMNTFQEHLQQSTARTIEKLHRTSERKRMERRFVIAAGATSAVDDAAVEAARLMPVIRNVIDVDLPNAIVRCLLMHRLSAAAVGARHIWEVAYQPECWGSRRRIVGLAEAAMETLEKYPHLVEDVPMMANLITLRSRVVPTCSNCPYLQHRVESAPMLCPTAITARIDPDRLRHDVH